MDLGLLGRLDVPVDLDRETAQRLARAELDKARYAQDSPGLVERAWSWLQDRLDDLLDAASGAGPTSRLGLLVVVVAGVLLVAVLLRRLEAFRRPARAGNDLLAGPVATAAEHRSAALAHAREERWADAVREHLRSIIRGLEERGLLAPRSGRTADEVAAEGGQALPERADDLRRAVQIFDAVWYGGRPASRESAAALDEIDQRVSATRPQPLRASR